MGENGWNWKDREGGRGGLLYEPGNWGDLLKLLWLSAAIRWKSSLGHGIAYFDPFAGDLSYPLSDNARRRLDDSGLSELDFIRPEFTARGRWPSAASAAGLLSVARRAVFDADAGRLGRWRDGAGVEALDGISGWELLAGREAEPGGLWLIDPYDFLAEWRERLPSLLLASRTATVLLYIYNRSPGDAAALKSYLAFRNALECGREKLPGRFGRAAADGFLPRACHEVFL
ncbi:MAG: hypothetical protein LBV15_04050, partial [Planctomycetota bacterium]|nr:hypothetical protein [Planctomycetota bacterium]